MTLSTQATVCVTDVPTRENPWSGPLLLIDCTSKCLIDTPLDARYIALSYTWGNDDESASAAQSNVANLQRPNGLETINLPQTIKDSMKFTRDLGERYLWVDRLCVIQDGIAKQSQLNAMGSIYANSYFTLVAAKSEDASGPLYSDRSDGWVNRGIRYKSRLHTENPPKLSGKSITFEQTQLLMSSRWYSRAWTLPEYLFSKRRVVFQGETVNWDCLYDSWHELQDVSKHNISKPQYSIAPPTGFCTSVWPDMERYSRLVSLFSRRNLTFPEDALDAFEGVLSCLSRTFQGGFISGLPQMCFDAALLW